MPENSDRANKQKQSDIRVIMGNPPYSSGQTSENDNNKNLKYEHLDNRIRSTYAEHSTGVLKNSLYDSYIRAIRWASDRIKDKGMVCYVTNGKFIESNIADGLRKCLADEFSRLYVFNLRGFIRGKSGDDAKREGQNIFDIMTGVAITLMIKNPNHQGTCELYYYDIGDYLNRKDKLHNIMKFGKIGNIPWQHITPNACQDWINPRNAEFESFLAIGNKDTKETEKMIFNIYSSGVKTNRDNWVYSFSKCNLINNMKRMVDFYNSQVSDYQSISKDKRPAVDSFIDTNPKNFSWTRETKQDLERNKKGTFYEIQIVRRLSLYRPYCQQHFYFDRQFNNCVYQMPKIFPNDSVDNLVISATGIGERNNFRH